MSQMNLAQLVNLQQIQPTVQITPPAIDYTEQNVIGGQIQVSDPQRVGMNYLAPSGEAAMFGALSEIARGVQQGFNNFDNIATSIEKKTIEDAYLEYDRINNLDDTLPEEKERLMNEYSRNVSTPYLGNKWKKDVANRMVKNWTSQEAQDNWYTTELKQFEQEYKKRDPNYIGNEEQWAVMLSEFYGSYPLAKNMPTIVNAQTRNDLKLREKKIEFHRANIASAIDLTWQLAPDGVTQEYVTGTGTLDSQKKFKGSYPAIAKTLDRFLDDPNLTQEDLVTLMQGEFDEAIWKPFLEQNPIPEPEYIELLKQDSSRIIKEKAGNLYRFHSSAASSRASQLSATRVITSSTSGTVEQYLKTIVEEYGNLGRPDMRTEVQKEFVPTLLERARTTNPLIQVAILQKNGNEVYRQVPFNEASVVDQYKFIEEKTRSTVKTMVEEGRIPEYERGTDITVLGQKLGTTKGFFEQTVQGSLVHLRYDKNKGFGQATDFAINRGLSGLSNVVDGVRKGIISTKERNLKTDVSLERMGASLGLSREDSLLFNYLAIQIDKNGNPVRETVVGQGIKPEDVPYKFNLEGDVSGWLRFMRKNHPEALKRLEQAGLYSAPVQDYINKIREKLVDVALAGSSPPDTSTSGRTTYQSDSKRTVGLLTDPSNMVEIEIIQNSIPPDQRSAEDKARIQSFEMLKTKAKTFEQAYKNVRFGPKGLLYDDLGKPVNFSETIMLWNKAQENQLIDEAGRLTPKGETEFVRVAFLATMVGEYNDVGDEKFNSFKNTIQTQLQSLAGNSFFDVIRDDPGRAYLSMATLRGFAIADPTGLRLSGIFGTDSEKIKGVNLVLDQFNRNGVMIPSLDELDNFEKKLSMGITMFFTAVGSQGGGSSFAPNDSGYLKPNENKSITTELALSLDPNSTIWDTSKFNKPEKWDTWLQGVFNTKSSQEVYDIFAPKVNLPDFNDETISVRDHKGEVRLWSDFSQHAKVLYAVGKYLNSGGQETQTFFSNLLRFKGQLPQGMDLKLMVEMLPSLTREERFDVMGRVVPPTSLERVVTSNTEGAIILEEPRQVKDAFVGKTRGDLLEQANKQNATQARVAGDTPVSAAQWNASTPFTEKRSPNAWVRTNVIKYVPPLSKSKNAIWKEGEYLQDVPKSDSDYIIDSVLSTQLIERDKNSYGFYSAACEDLGLKPLSYDEYSNSVSDFHRWGSTIYGYSKTPRPTLWEFMSSYHNVDLTEINNRRLDTDSTGALVISIPTNTDIKTAKLSIKTFDSWSTQTTKTSFTTTDEFDEYQRERELLRLRLAKYRAMQRLGLEVPE